jgi:hypothetical protein
MQSKKNIVFVGDSYCSSWRGPSGIAHQYAQQHDPDLAHSSWLDVTADKLDLTLYSFGFIGRSWYFSKRQLFKYMEANPKWIKSVDLMVFCHTDSARFNTECGDIGKEMINVDYAPHPDDADPKRKLQLAKSVRVWYADLMDYPYQDWVQEQWFHEIARTFKDIKQIHFNNFTNTVQSASSILPGVVYTTPLVHVSLGEALGTDSEIVKNYLLVDQRANHFSTVNNIALAEVVVTTALDYRPGARPIDLSNFYQPNKNASRWPEPGFGTR